jgi:hypothetical protein
MLLGRCLATPAAAGGCGAVREPSGPPALGGAALLLGLGLALVSLPPFALGFWDKGEPVVVAFHAAAALASLAVAWGLWAAPAAAMAGVAHPYVLAPLALGLWSAVAAPFTALPLQSLMGAPQSGHGALWFLDFAAFMACALMVASHRRLWRCLVAAAIALALVVAAIKGWDRLSLARGEGHLLIFVAAFYGWLALPLPLLVWRDGPPKAAAALLAMGAALVLALASASLSAVAVLVLAAPLMASQRVSRRVGPGLALGIVLAAAVLPWIALHGLPALLQVESLRDRWLVQRMVQAALAHDPSLLVGHGWGATQDAFRVWLNTSGERLWNPTWTYLVSDYFHSHNWGVEALYAAGIPGLLLALAGFMVIPRFARPDCRGAAAAFAAALAMLSGLWFPLALSVPLTALGLAAVAGPTAWQGGRFARGAAAALTVLALVQGTAAVALLDFGLRVTALRQAWEASPPVAAPIPQDWRGGDLAVAEMIRADRILPAEDGGVLESMVEFVDRRGLSGRTVLILEAGIAAMSRAHPAGQPDRAASAAHEQAWRNWTIHLLELAPTRTDQAIPLLSYWIGQGRLAEVAEFAAAMRRRTPEDPVGLHFAGLAMAAGGDGRGMALMRDGLERGIERFIPMDAATKRILSGQ